jgi:hypothetical protein
MIAVGIDRLVVPDTYQPDVILGKIAHPIGRVNAARQNHLSLKTRYYSRRLVGGFSKTE